MTQPRLNPYLHLLYVVLYEVSVAAALWQKGEPLVTVGALLLFPFIALASRLPLRIFPKIIRQILQVLFAGGAIAWGYYRYRTVPPDLALVEATALLGFALSISGEFEEYNLLAVISLIMAGYGGLSPNRQIYLPALVCYAVTGLLLLYETRTIRLLGTGIKNTIVPRYRKNWAYRLLHLTLFGALFVTFLLTFPFPYVESVGIIPVSFDAHQELYFPKLWKNWLGSTKKVLVSEEGEEVTESGTDSPTVQKEDAETLIENTEESMDAREGNGGGGIGRDLLFRVHSPAKLYWLVQLYDSYDGQKWTKSNILKSGRSPLDRPDFRSSRAVAQFYSIEKTFSKWIPGAYYVQHYVWQRDNDDEVSQKRSFYNKIVREPLGLGQIDGENPPLPWEYKATSLIGSGVSEKFKDILPKPVPQAQEKLYYLNIHNWLLSKRLRNLTEELVQGVSTPLAKAEALRDYLRQNCAYTLTPPAIPEDAETVDYFLFKSKKGYCQHFAQALTVMARLAGLPARVATGFAPGNYNLLTGYFEVHEYHAHAWTQIFVEPFGWLTFDGVPPGALSMDTKPSMVSNMIDPFGEAWEARPPELNVTPPPREDPEMVRQVEQEQVKDSKGKLAEAYNKVYEEAAAKSGNQTPSAKDLAKAAFEEAKVWLINFWKKLQAAFLQWSRNFLNKTMRFGLFLKDYMRTLNHTYLFAALFLFVVLLAILRKQNTVLRVFSNWRVQKRCSKRWKILLAKQQEPWIAVRMCHELVHELLVLAHFERPGNMDLLEYAEWLRLREPDIAGDLQIVSSVFTRQHFGGGRATGAEAQVAMESTARLREHLLLHWTGSSSGSRNK